MKDDFKVRAVRLDSGDLGALSRESRRLLDEAGLQRVEVFASGGLDEYAVSELLESGAPIDGFGVGTGMGVSSDAPALDIAYKLVEYAGLGRLKLSTGKLILPGRKQVFRIEQDGRYTGDIIGRDEEDLPGTPLLAPVMRYGRRLHEATATLDDIRDYSMRQVGKLPERVRQMTRADPPYPVEVSTALSQYQEQVETDVASREGQKEDYGEE